MVTGGNSLVKFKFGGKSKIMAAISWPNCCFFKHENDVFCMLSGNWFPYMVAIPIQESTLPY